MYSNLVVTAGTGTNRKRVWSDCQGRESIPVAVFRVVPNVMVGIKVSKYCIRPKIKMCMPQHRDRSILVSWQLSIHHHHNFNQWKN